MAWNKPYLSTYDIGSARSDPRAAQFPGRASRGEVATGLLLRGVRVNGSYCIVENCSVFPHQEITEQAFIQGGAHLSIADIGKKTIEGEITCPLRVDRNGRLIPALSSLLRHAEDPTVPIRLDTNHALSALGLTAENGGADGNLLLSLDCLVVKELSLTAGAQGVKMKITFAGMVDGRGPIDYLVPPDAYKLGRALTWGDCTISRYESAMRTVMAFELTVSNEVDLPVFLVGLRPDGTDTGRSDQPGFVGVKQCKWGGNFEEMLRLGLDRETMIHGGWMQGENLALTFGPITATLTVPLFVPAEQPLTANFLRRKTAFFAMTVPSARLGQGGLFDFSEDSP